MSVKGLLIVKIKYTFDLVFTLIFDGGGGGVDSILLFLLDTKEYNFWYFFGI